MSRRLVATSVALVVLLAACGNDSEQASTTTTERDAGGEVAAQVAGYDRVAGRAQRFLVGLVAGDGRLVGFGEVDLAFSYLGTEDEPQSPGRPGPRAEATYRLVPGQSADPATPGPRFIEPSDGTGVYVADDVLLDAAGFWEVVVTARVGNQEVRADAKFEVAKTSSGIPFPGDPAPRTENLLPGDPEASPTAVDSRAEDDGTVPDPELHRVTVADAIAAGRPVMVVVSTPVYCVSRFCGPITDAVQALAREHGDRMDFVHIEVWRDFEGKALNRGAAEWIFPEGAEDANEPWVFLVGSDRIVVERWDNVAPEDEMRQAVTELLGG